MGSGEKRKLSEFSDRDFSGMMGEKYRKDANDFESRVNIATKGTSNIRENNTNGLFIYNIRMYIYIYTHTHANIFTHMYICRTTLTYTHKHIYIYIYIYIHTDIYMHAYTYIHIYHIITGLFIP